MSTTQPDLYHTTLNTDSTVFSGDQHDALWNCWNCFTI